MISWSLLKAVIDYVKRLFGGGLSLLVSSFSTIPYLLSMGDFRKEVTEQYPDPVSSRNQDDLPPRFRGLLENDINKCTGCGDCQKI